MISKEQSLLVKINENKDQIAFSILRVEWIRNMRQINFEWESSLEKMKFEKLKKKFRE